jgi:S-DNA-T family DNA segregation ATPase FtsK/SpoIIIE
MSRHSRGRRKQPFKLKLPKETIYTLISTGLITAGGLILVSLSRQGAFLTLIFTWFNRWFGWGILLLPFIFLSAGLMLTRLRWRVTKPNVFIGAAVLLVSATSLTRSGFIGQQIWENLTGLIYRSGAVLVLVAGIFISLVVIFETSLEDILLGLQLVFNKLRSAFVYLKSRRQQPLFKPQPAGFVVKGLDSNKPKSVTKPGSEKPSPAAPVSPAAANKPGVQQTMWHYPPLSLLADFNSTEADRGDIKANAGTIEHTLDDFGIRARIVEVNKGPAVTQYCIDIAKGTKLSKITSLQNDLALALAAPQGQIRIEAPIPGRSYVGLELPNRSLEIVPIKEVLGKKEMREEKSRLAFPLGKNVSGDVVVSDIDKMPHVLIAGATNSGKSVCINSIISTILFRASPEEVRMILVDPKRVELTLYNDIPHLLTPVIVEPEKVVSALKWAISEMERRYKVFAEVGVRNIAGYNELSGFQALPYILIIIDELAEIILFAPSDVEDAITRLAQMARATGIHLVLATQRPSVDVLTGLIKANINCRISFNVNSMVDSRVIIDLPGAEKLLGRGDMLYIPPDQAKPTRIQGTFISEKDTKNLIEFIKKSSVRVEYTEEVTQKFKVRPAGQPGGPESEETDPLFAEACRLICQYNRASASLLQRRLSIGYARAARILDQLQFSGAVGPAEGAKAREVLISNADSFLSQRNNENNRQPA